MSKKRILPAVVLAGTVGFLGLHRMYAGRWVTGLAQLGMAVCGWVLLRPEIAEVAKIGTLEQMEEWVAVHGAGAGINPAGALLFCVPAVWAVWDCLLLLAGRFKDGAGERMTAWI